MRKKFLLIIILLNVLCIFSVKAQSFSKDTYTTRGGGVPNQLTKPFLGQAWSNSTTNLVGRYDNGTGINLFYKYAPKESVATLCTSFGVDNKLSTMDSNYFYKNNCSKISSGKNPYRKDGKDWSSDPAVASGVASIIIEATGGIGTGHKLSLSGYHTAELAINYYLATASGTCGKKGCYKLDGGKNAQYSPGKKLKSVGDAAEDDYINFSKKKNSKNKLMSMDINNFQCKQTNNAQGYCTFKVVTKNISNYSNTYSKITKGNLNITVNRSGATVSKISDNEYKIDNIDISENGNIEVSVDLPITRTYYKAQNYKCGGNQTLTPNQFDTATQTIHFKKTKKATLKGKTTGTETTYYDAYSSGCTLLLSKVSNNDVPLEGSKISYSLSSSSEPGEIALNDIYDGTDVLTEEETIENPVYNSKCFTAFTGTGTLTVNSETAAPIGYKFGSIRYTDGTIIEDGVIPYDSDNPKEVEIVNDPNTNLIIKKVDGKDNSPVVGAKLSISLNGKDLELIDVVENNVTYKKVKGICPDNTDCSWTTDATGAVHIIGLDYYQSYQINEVSPAPDYRSLKEYNDLSVPVVFTIPESVEADQNDSYDDEIGRNQTITLTNFKSTIPFSKQDITNGKEVVGAHLKVIDAAANIIDEWDSTSTPHNIKNLPNGTYYLVETLAPSGYELNETKVEFVVENGQVKVNDKITNEVVITNSPRNVPSPNTLLNKQIITYVLGLSLIIGGLGVLAYELKKKKVLSK